MQSINKSDVPFVLNCSSVKDMGLWVEEVREGGGEIWRSFWKIWAERC